MGTNSNRRMEDDYADGRRTDAPSFPNVALMATVPALPYSIGDNWLPAIYTGFFNTFSHRSVNLSFVFSPPYMPLFFRLLHETSVAKDENTTRCLCMLLGLLMYSYRYQNHTYLSMECRKTCRLYYAIFLLPYKGKYRLKSSTAYPGRRVWPTKAACRV